MEKTGAFTATRSPDGCSPGTYPKSDSVFPCAISTARRTSGTADAIRKLGLPVREIKKLDEGSNAIIQFIRSGTCAAVLNTPTLGRSVQRDGFLIRRAAVESRVPCLTSLDTAGAVVTALQGAGAGYSVAPLREYREQRVLAASR